MKFVIGILLLVVSFRAVASSPDRYESQHIIVKFRDGVSDQDVQTKLSKHRLQHIQHVGDGSLGQIHRVRVPAGQTEQQAISDMLKEPNVEFAEVNGIARSSSIPNDPYFSNQWHHADINTIDAWDLQTGRRYVKIAILDTGIDPTHPDLVRNLIPGYNIVDHNTNTADIQGHGTAVAGLAAAAGNNPIGVTGVCWICSIMPVRIASYDPSTGSALAYWSDIASGMRWAVDQGARIENISYVNLLSSSTILSAASYVNSKGGVITAAAGNDATNPGYAMPTSMLMVSATDINSERGSFTDFGPWVALSAPGVNITSTNMNGDYSGGLNGTSFSAPIVAGVAGLMLSANYSLRFQDVMQLLEYTADDKGLNGKDNYYGYGKVNAERAVASAIGVMPTAPNFVANSGFEYGPALWTPIGTTATISLNPHSGSHAAYVQTGSGYGQIVRNLTPSTTYTLSAWVVAGANGIVQICATGYGGANVCTRTNSQTYTKLSVNFTTGTTSKVVRIVGNVPRGVAWMDDFSVVAP